MSEQITMYQTDFFGSRSKIEPIKVDRVTEKSIFLGDTRRAISSEWGTYHATWANAKAHLQANAERRLQAAKISLEDAEKQLADVIAIADPTA